MIDVPYEEEEPVCDNFVPEATTTVTGDWKSTTGMIENWNTTTNVIEGLESTTGMIENWNTTTNVIEGLESTTDNAVVNRISTSLCLIATVVSVTLMT